MREYAAVLLVAMVVTYLLTPIARKLATVAGALAKVRDRDVHAIATPRWGGLAILGGLAVGMQVARHLPALSGVFSSDSLNAGAPPEAILTGALVICAVGAIDDRWELDALTKLAGQILAAGVTVLQGVQLYFIPLPKGPLLLSPEVSAPITILFILVTINAVNFIDGLDGLAAGVVAIAALTFFAYSYEVLLKNKSLVMATPTLVMALLAGACLGFLPHNFSPARVFMGDSGSMLLGLVLGGATVSLTGTIESGQLGQIVNIAYLPIVLPFAVLAVPFADLGMAVLRRTWAGRSPFSPDKLHLHHRLLEIGHSQTRAVLLMYFWAALVGTAMVALAFSRGWQLIVAVAGCFALVALVVSNIPRLRAARRP
ncbi:MAG: UDP-GlcNAc:undecaprenyl-phosphate/decaprenyl-phosphate GlcNAc-phosphate transferase [Frankiales bacterium]|jgi:UDP-GlcNAc:undecaprenyl-phosphate GlcNAc-1-phosphate transferase|nr:UDP-GlcNAc:undecaprenyl-phosphate/decaprenyl-phosphate GlcNAc-phosphate transferase [Frankiales bacterium]MDX6208552.1 UDP-GlcNAc:undecaprenyl-phosphate/decaprenyl-phosphate GlcNAc-phosphate transferase [Frankiales bacterium]MDX6213648.1 UDP-GlcNAc:undecaprenyl-phosphate/decaprenyl-phosphate GlcNAc-phosphate transferase [Frankiales bacterium]